LTTHNNAPLASRLNPECRAAMALYRTQLDGVPGLSERTRLAYVDGVKRFLAWVSDPATVLDHGNPLTDPVAKRWAVSDWRSAAVRGTIKARGGAKYAPATIRATLEALNDFYTRLGLGGLPAEEAKRPAMAKKAPVALRGEVRRRSDRVLHTWADARDRAVLGLLRYAGLRKSEVVALDVDDVPMSARKGDIRILGKGEKLRFVKMHPVLRGYLTDWLEVRRASPGAEGPALFLAPRGNRLAARTVNDITGRFGKAAGLEVCYPHLFRDTFITELVRDRKHDIVLVAEIAGHESLDTTRRYALPDDDDLAAAIGTIDTSHLE
jgi:integrase/recombinase XerC